jgi:hypothetical protein
MNDLTELIERATADQPPLSITRDSAVAAGRRALRRRRQGTAVLGIAAVAAVVTGVTAVPHFRGTGGPIGGPSSPVPDTYQVPQLPVANGVPGAADQPSLVGTDPRLVHFSVPTSAWPVGEAHYQTDTDRGTETIMAGGLTVTVSRTRAPAEETANSGSKVSVTKAGSSSPIPPQLTNSPTTVAGHPATLYSAVFPDGTYPYFGVLWQPVDGLWVGVFAATQSGVAELWADVAALDLQRAERIVVPFQLTWAPPNVHLLGISAGIPTDQPYAFSSANWSDDRGNTVTVSFGERARPVSPGSPSGPPSFGPLETNRTVAGHPVQWTDGTCPEGRTPCGGTFVSDDYDGAPLELTVAGYDEATATHVLAGLRISQNLKDPSSWPTDLIAH